MKLKIGYVYCKVLDLRDLKRESGVVAVPEGRPVDVEVYEWVVFRVLRNIPIGASFILELGPTLRPDLYQCWRSSYKATVYLEPALQKD